MRELVYILIRVPRRRIAIVVKGPPERKSWQNERDSIFSGLMEKRLRGNDRGDKDLQHCRERL
jgi:hypothetical protein